MCVCVFGAFGMFDSPRPTRASSLAEGVGSASTRGGRRARGGGGVVSRVVVSRFSSSRASLGARDDAGEAGWGESARERERERKRPTATSVRRRARARAGAREGVERVE